MIDNVIQATCVLTNVANCKNECKGKCEHQKLSKSTVSKYVGGAEKAYQDITTRVSGISGMEHWNGILEWNGGIKHWNGIAK